MSDIHRSSFRVPADHPSLPGHFPDNPVVPGVLLLAQVLQAAEGWTGAVVQSLRLPQVKFLVPLLPEQEAAIEIRRSGSRLRFSVRHGERLIASGDIETAP